MPIVHQCQVLGLARSTFYYQPTVGECEENIGVMHEIDRIYTEHPFYGVPRITFVLGQRGYPCNHKRVARLMRVMGLAATSPGPHTSTPTKRHPVYPYLLRGRTIQRVDEVWSADITYVPMHPGHLYLVALIDWYSRYVLSWELSNTLDTVFCLAALDTALDRAQPEIVNTDQGTQFTSDAWLCRLHARDVRISMDGRGRALDNVFVERLWRTVKYENLYLHAYRSGTEVRDGLARYVRWYNAERPHQALGYLTPQDVYEGRRSL